MSAAKPRYVIHYPIQDGDSSESTTTADITDRVSKGGWARAQNGRAWFSFKCSTKEVDRIVRVGDWLTIHDPAGVVYDFFYITSANYAVATNAGTGGVSCTGNVNAISWYALLGKFTVMGTLASQTIGTYQSVQDLVKTMSENISLYVGSKTGEALAALWRGLARIKMPPSLGGEFLGDAIPVVYDEQTADVFAPELLHIIDPVPSSISGNINSPVFFAQASILEMMSRLFVFDPRLVDLRPYQVYGNLGIGERSSLAKALGVRPILLYRMFPFRSEPLANSAISYDGFQRYTKSIAAPKPTDTENQQKFIAGASTVNLIAAQAQAATATFSKVTWRTDKAVKIPPSWVVGFNLEYDDASRANIFAVNFLENPANSVIAAPALRLPIINEDSVLYHGARPMVPDWPAIITAKDAWQEEKPNLPPPVAGYIRAIAAQAAQWYMASHRLASGRVVISPPDANVWTPDQSIEESVEGVRALRIMPGDLVVFPSSPTGDRYIAFVTGVTHEWAAGQNGSISLKASFDYIFAARENDPITGSGKYPAEEILQTIKSGGPAPRRNTARPVTAAESGAFILANEERIPYPGSVYHLPFNSKNISSWMITNRVADGFFTSPLNNNGVPVTSVVLHTHDGNHKATGYSMHRFFQRQMELGIPLSVHFMIEPSGQLFQYLDCAMTAWHAEWANSFSIGVELIIPFSHYRSASQHKARAPEEFPWPVLSPLGSPESQEWRIYSETSQNSSHAVKELFGPTDAQVATLTKLLATLHNKLGVSLVHEKGTSWPFGFRRLGKSFVQKRCAIPGAAGLVLHHAQVSSNRIDALGVPLDTITQAARSL